jgi:hypothetical protein
MKPGSIGALFFIGEKDLSNLHVITAGHCVELENEAGAATDEDNQQDVVFTASGLKARGANDFAVLPLKISSTTNLWAINPVFNNDIKNWLVEDETIFEPGTVVVKVGAGTG